MQPKNSHGLLHLQIVIAKILYWNGIFIRTCSNLTLSSNIVDLILQYDPSLFLFKWDFNYNISCKSGGCNFMLEVKSWFIL